MTTFLEVLAWLAVAALASWLLTMGAVILATSGLDAHRIGSAAVCYLLAGVVGVAAFGAIVLAITLMVRLLYIASMIAFGYA